jgi:flagellar basal-body rod protein FlgB
LHQQERRDGSRNSEGRRIFADRGKRLPPHAWFRTAKPSARKLARLLLKDDRTSLETVMSEGLFGIHGTALEIRAQRMGMLGSNIANAATPGYKARDVDFASALQARMAGADEEQSIGSATRYRVPVMPSLDGNTVEMATEQTAFAENAVAYTATLGFLRGRIETVTRAIRGE